MSNVGSVFQKGGGGTNFEQAVQTAFLTTLIIRGNAPLNHANEIIEVAFQTTNRGCETDDLLIVAKSAIGQHRLLVQIKHNITFTPDNEIFKEVITAFWKDYNNPIFDRDKDKLIIIKSGFTKEERNHLKSLLNWAKTHVTENDFVTEVNRIKGKKNRLDVFRVVLKEVNNNTSLTDKEIWEFLKCTDVLEYDLTNQNSVDETYFLNLIKLSKSKTTTLTEKEIWDVLLSFDSKLNKDGGNVTTTSILNEELYKHFDTSKLNPYFKAVDKLRNDSKAVLSPLKNTIGGFHLERKNINEIILNSINNNQFTIVTGRPGVGKSAIIKDVLKDEFATSTIFAFRADQFSEPTVANVFSSQGVNETIEDIFSCISIIPDKLIFIDSIEKLLEADPDCAFKQLFVLLKQFPDIKVICSSRKYAIDLIALKFGIDNNEIGLTEIPPLDECELEIVSKHFPQLQKVLQNVKIKKLLQSPKYLDFASLALNKSGDDYANISLTEFKDKLWNSLVVNSTNTKNGLPIKRENAFMEIAVNRAREMKLFTKPINADAEAIVLLEHDEIIFQEKQNRKYSPTHDILEDWALVKYVAAKYEEYSNPNDLFENLGNEPSIRRAFRLWVEDHLIDNSNKINDLIRLTINNVSIEKYWADEILIAVFKSENCASFFSMFINDLLNEEGKFRTLNRCIHLMRTACKESNPRNNDLTVLLPAGSGWREIVLFINEHVESLDVLTLSICNLLYDWEYRLLFQSASEDETLAAKRIVLHYIRQIDTGNEYWQEGDIKQKTKGLISLLFNIANIAKTEITELIERAFQEKKDGKSRRVHSFYQNVVATCLSGLGNQKLIEELPELVIQSAWNEWKLRLPEKKFDPDNRIRVLLDSRLRGDDCWGIPDKRSFSPSGVYKTPIYNLLFFHPSLAIKFITQFINYSVDFYNKADCEYKHRISQIEIKLNDGSTIKQWAAWELWGAYRGVSVTHYAIESILMSLEKYLLEIAALDTEVSKSNVKFIFNYLLRNSNNVAVTSVLASIAIAYPTVVENEMIPLLSVREFYEWDLSRAAQEPFALAPHDDSISFAQKERWTSNKLPHRRKFMRGLRDFVLDYQYNIRKLNKEIHNVFDKLKSSIPNDDILWKKTLIDMDVRNHKVAEYDEKLKGFPILPVYDEEITEFEKSNSDEFMAESKSIGYATLLTKAYETKEHLEFSVWEESFNHYSLSEDFNLLYDRPVTLSAIGLRDFLVNLNTQQMEWCVETISRSIATILDDTFKRDFSLTMKFNLLEKQIALSSFHLLFSAIKSEEDQHSLTVLMIHMLVAPFGHHELDKIINYTRVIFFQQHPLQGRKIWYALIQYAKFKKSNRYFYDDPNQARLQEALEKEKAFIERIAKSEISNLNVEEINFQSYTGYLLARAFAVTPFYPDDKSFSDFILHFIPLLTTDIQKDEDYVFNKTKDPRQIGFEEASDSRSYLAELILRADGKLAKSVLDLILDPIYKNDSVRVWGVRDGLFEFSSRLLESVIYKLDKILPNSNDEVLNKQLIKNFWLIWKYFFEKVLSSGKLYFTSILLCDIEWKTESTHWIVLEGEKEFYYKMIDKIGKTNTKSIINLLSTVGEKTFLPDGISRLVEIYKIDPSARVSLISHSAERLIKRLFYKHISAIKSDKKLISDFIWILDHMVDFGSSNAYLFRENVITYKTIN
jgi:hypothetical protein